MYNPIDICATFLQTNHLTIELREIIHSIIFTIGGENEANSFGHRGRKPERSNRVFLGLFVFQVVDSVDYQDYFTVVHDLVANYLKGPGIGNYSMKVEHASNQ